MPRTAKSNRGRLGFLFAVKLMARRWATLYPSNVVSLRLFYLQALLPMKCHLSRAAGPGQKRHVDDHTRFFGTHGATVNDTL